MNAAFFALALSAAVSPSQLAVDFALTANRRPRAMLLCVLFGALATAITVNPAVSRLATPRA